MHFVYEKERKQRVLTVLVDNPQEVACGVPKAMEMNIHD